MENIVNIKLEHIHPHPDNPRKELGDLTELVESIKKNGIMQNLTVIPMEGREGEYMAIIGHRRSAAAKLAGLIEAPCRIIEGMSLKEQVSTMLEENMQRNDLTVYEQAQGFQMMLDLGETEDSIAEKTGFSRSTIRRRLNIAKLDPVVLQKKEKDESFQLTLKDLYELDKVEDVATRNKILSEANSSRDIAWKAQNAAREEQRAKTAAVLIGKLKEKGIKPAPKSAENERWSGKWDSIKEFDLDKDAPEEITYKARKDDELFYVKWYTNLVIIRKAAKKENKVDKEQQERTRKEKAIKGMYKEMDKRRKEFVDSILCGKIASLKEEASVRDEIWKSMLELRAFVTSNELKEFFLKKRYYESSKEEQAESEQKVCGLSVLHQMLIILHNSMRDKTTFTWDLKYKPEEAAVLIHAYEILKRYGWSFEGDEEKLLDGTHEFYTKADS